MLVLGRRTKERIVIDENIEVAILEIRGNRVQLGIKAPRSVAIRRFEMERRDTDEIDDNGDLSTSRSSSQHG